MTPSPENEQRLARTIDRTLRELPARRAPRSLESRVLAELARLEALPWWRKSFVHWPLPARLMFLLLSVGLAAMVVIAGIWGGAGFEALPLRSMFAQEFTWFDNAASVYHAIRSFGEIMLRNIPPLWLYGGLAFIAAMYAAFFGLGAAAFKALHAPNNS
jgi:hypothetical protein